MAKTIKQKEINLLLALDRTQGKVSSEVSSKKIATIVVIAVIVLLIAGAAVYYFLTMSNLNKEKDEINSFVTDPYQLSQQQESATARDQAALMQGFAEVLAGAMDGIESYPDLSSAQLEQIVKLSGENVTLSNLSYDRSTGILSINGTADTAARVPLYVTKLRLCGVFSDIAYSGYSAGELIKETGGTTTDEEGNEVVDTKALKVYTFSITALVIAPGSTSAAPAVNDTEAGGGTR
jgi:hypothetical protein